MVGFEYYDLYYKGFSVLGLGVFSDVFGDLEYISDDKGKCSIDFLYSC